MGNFRKGMVLVLLILILAARATANGSSNRGLAQSTDNSSPISAPAATVIGALIGLVGGFVVAEINRRQKADELFFKALDFLKGGSQERNLGISAIELYWRRRRHRPLCVSLLAGSAIYLLRESKQGAAEHERYNLDRVMDLLLTKKTRVGSSYLPSYNRLLDAVQKKAGGASGGLDVELDKLNAWGEELASIAGRRWERAH